MSRLSTEQTVAELTGCLQRLCNCVAGYIAVAQPYAGDRDKAAMGAVKEIAASDQETALACEGVIVDLEGIPLTGLPNAAYAELNYLSFPFLLDFMATELDADVVYFTQALERLQAAPAPAKALAERALAERRAQSAKVKGIRANNYKVDGAAA